MNTPLERTSPACPVFVLGVSGATWDVAKPLLRSGRLPHLQRLMERGCAGTLLSVRSAGDKHYRPQVAWVSLATGCLPETHGVTAFYHTAEDCRRPSLWDWFQADGRSVGLFAWPMTWPPKPVQGFDVPCYHARDNSTWPPELASIKRMERRQHEARQGREAVGSPLRVSEWADVLTNLWTNGVRLSAAPALAHCAWRYVTGSNGAGRALGLRHGKLEISTEMFLHLYRRWRPQFSSFHAGLVDNISHRYWRYREPEPFGEATGSTHSDLASAVDDAYIRTDRILGKILRELPERAIVAVLSEHGMAAEYESAEVGQWQYVIRGARLAEIVGLADELSDLPIARWISYRPRVGHTMPAAAAARFRQVKVVETGLPLFNVYEHGAGEVIVKFSIDKRVPAYREGNLADLHIEYGGQHFAFGEIARKLGRQRSAMHAERGMLVLSGPGIKRGATLPDCRITDIAPTLLAAAGVPAAGPFDGRVIDEAFERGSATG